MEITVGHQGCRREETGAPSGTADRALLAANGPREVRWATVYLALYVPGVAWATRYLVVYAVPSIARIAHLSLGAIGTDGLVSLSGVGGALALALCFGPLGWTLWGVARNAARVARTTLRPTPAG
jgi:putative peptide zinc metalloprotease protein